MLTHVRRDNDVDTYVLIKSNNTLFPVFLDFVAMLLDSSLLFSDLGFHLQDIMGRLGGCLRTGFVCTPPLNRFGPSEFAQLFKYARDSKYKHKDNHATFRFLWAGT